MSDVAGADLSPDAVRAEVAQWIENNWDPELPLARWRELLAGSGWACPTWPADWCGRSLTPELGRIVTTELQRAVVPGPPEGIGMMLVAPVLLEYGSDELKQRFVRRTVTGEVTWCQLFSEPGAGSDLAGLQARATRDGDGWLLTGQKVWSTGAATADFGLLLGRTDWDVPKHQGITAFVLPMRQPGVQVRPLRQMNGHSSFNEVFFDAARIPGEYVIGEPGAGWLVARTPLAHHGRLPTFPGPPTTAPGRAWGGGRARRAPPAQPPKRDPPRGGGAHPLSPPAPAPGRGPDPGARQEGA